MFFWNRIEIYSGFSYQEFIELRNALLDANLRYDYRFVHHNTKNSFRINQKNDYSTMYYLYVHQKDYEEAMYLTSNRHMRADK